METNPKATASAYEYIIGRYLYQLSKARFSEGIISPMQMEKFDPLPTEGTIQFEVYLDGLDNPKPQWGNSSNSSVIIHQTNHFALVVVIPKFVRSLTRCSKQWCSSLLMMEKAISCKQLVIRWWWFFCNSAFSETWIWMWTWLLPQWYWTGCFDSFAN